MNSTVFDWSDYNKKKAREVEILFDPEYIASKLSIPEVSNIGKRGHPFVYTNAEIAFYTVPAIYLRLPLRQAQGLAKILAKIADNENVPNFSTLSRRKKTIIPEVNMNDMSKKTTIAIDSTGIKVTNRGDWLRKKWRKERKGFIKLHLAVDVESKEILAYEITDENSHDNRQFDNLVEKSKKKRKVNKVLGDGAYDTKENFNRKDVEVAIRIRKNASNRADGSMARKRAAKEQKENWDKWRTYNEYGKRWMAETVNSIFKGRFGEAVTSKIFENMKQELAWKVMVLNMMRVI